MKISIRYCLRCASTIADMTLSVHVWSDIVCPWCFIGKRRLERAISEFGQEVDVVWHSFELDPKSPRVDPKKRRPAVRLAEKYQMPVARAQTMMQEMSERGKKENIDFSLDDSKTLNSFDAHRLIHLALAANLQDNMKERLFVAHFSEGVDCSNRGELLRLALEVGLPESAVQEMFNSDEFANDVRKDEQRAQELQVRGVPFFVVGRYGVAGAQSTEVLLQTLDRAHLDEDGPDEAGSDTKSEDDSVICKDIDC